MSIDAELLEILACPGCKGEVREGNTNDGGEAIVCKRCSLAFPVRDDIPVMLLDEAEKI